MADGGRRFIACYADGGVLGRNPSPRGVYWSVRIEDGAVPPVILRRRSGEYKTNNDAEWLAVREVLRYTAEHHPGVPIVVHSDSKLVVRQFNKTWRVRIARHFRFAAECWRLADGRFVAVKWVPRRVSVEKVGH